METSLYRTFLSVTFQLQTILLFSETPIGRFNLVIVLT